MVTTWNYAIWSSYGIKTHNFDVTLVNVIPFVVGMIASGIYLYIKPEGSLFKQWFVLIVLSVVINLPMIPATACGMLGTFSSIMGSSVSLIYIPGVIETKNTSSINLPICSMNLVNFIFWTIIAVWIQDVFMITS
jgi:uncharacterized protein with PQ loop repeat